jgi:uncharacterized protein (DUF2236 family)
MKNNWVRRKKQAPLPKRHDYGFFGPSSVTWKVWTAPTVVIGFQRAVTLEHFDPFFAAAIADGQGIYKVPRHRLDGTLSFWLTVAVADGHTAIEASGVLMRAHAKVTGIEPISGKRYNANNPKQQLGAHVNVWHCMLKS